MPIPGREADSGTLALSRRAFLGCCAALAAASAGCAGLAPRTRAGYALATDPPLEQYQPILHALVEAILPFERPDFPVSAEAVRSRLLRLFRLEEDARFSGLQRALVLFDQMDLFARFPIGDEAMARDAAARQLDAAALTARSRGDDARRYDAFIQTTGAAGAFNGSPLAIRREYLDLWRASGFVVKRQFHASARSLVMISAYSMDAVWPAIGYGGPLLPGRTRE
jgi:hypothetical protein